MTEPVAYLNNYKDKSTNITRFKPIDNTSLVSSKKLYTAEQPHPRVKMTQAEFDELKKLKSLNPTVDLIAILKIVSSFKYKNLQSRFVCGSIENQTEFATLWLRARYERLEELIEIIPDMKWFVRSKESEINGYGWLSIIDKYKTPIYQYSENRPFGSTVGFDTKEEAEKWTNPLTEVVQLPVEEE